MRVVLEAQHAVGTRKLRGVGQYSLDLISALLRRNMFEYEVTFFDYGKERGNYDRAVQYFGKYHVPLHECNTLDYRIATRDESVFSEKSYNSYTNTNGDLYHFMCPFSIPTNLFGKMVVTLHDVIGESFPTTISPQVVAELKTAYGRINRIKPFIITDSMAARNDVLTYMDVPEENVEIIYISYDETHMYPDQSDISHLVEGDYFLYVGSIERRKNVAAILEAFKRIASRYAGIKLVIAGGQNDQDYCDMLHQTADFSFQREQIIFTGYVDVETKRKLYSHAKCFVFPSFCEGFGLPVLEAMACGCPVITADNTSLPEVGGDAARYVNAHNVEQLAHEMERVLTDISLRNSMIQKGFVQKARFSWDKTAEQVENFYKKVCERQ